MTKVCLTRSLSSLCLGKEVGRIEAQSGVLATPRQVRRRHSLINVHALAAPQPTGPSQSGLLRSETESAVIYPSRLARSLQSSDQLSPHVPETASSTSGAGSFPAVPHAVACMATAAEFPLLTGATRMAQVKGWVWLVNQSSAAERLVASLKHEYGEAEPDTTEHDDLASRLRIAQERLQRLEALGKRLRDAVLGEIRAAQSHENQTAENGNDPEGQDNTVWKLSRLSPDRMPIEFLALLPPSATAIDLAENKITEIPGGTFDRFNMLQRLNLSGNRITTLHRDSLRGLENLVALDLSGNAIDSMDPDALSTRLALEDITLSGNQLSALPRLPKRLRQANFSGNALTAIEPERLAWLTRLRVLNLNGNQLHAFKVPVTGLKRLRTLCLGFNHLTCLERSLMRLVPNLRTLMLADNRLTEITAQSMQGPPGHPSRLRRLSLAGNAIQRIEDGAFSGQLALQLLDLEDNRLCELSHIFPKTSALMRINLSHNLLRAIGDGLFDGMSNLRELDLSHNQIANVSEYALGAAAQASQDETLLHIRLHDNALDHFPVRLHRRGWVKVDLHNNHFTSTEAARLDASHHDGPGVTCVLRLTNFASHESGFNRWLGKPFTRLLGALRYVAEADTFYEFLHIFQRIGSPRTDLPAALHEKRARIAAALLDRVETLLPVLAADESVARQCFGALKSGLEGCGDRAMFAWWLMEIECRKQGILRASPDRLQLVQLGVWLHRMEKLLQFAKVLSARNTGNAAEAVEIQLWLFEALHHHVLGDLGRPQDMSMQILYKSAVLVDDDDLLEIQHQIAMAESADDYPEVLADYLQTQPFWLAHLGGDLAWQEMVQNFENALTRIETDYRSESFDLMAQFGYEADHPDYRVKQTALDTQRAQDLATTRAAYTRQTMAPVRTGLEQLAAHARARSLPPDTAETSAQRHAAGWQWLDQRIAQMQAEWLALPDEACDAETGRRGKRGTPTHANALYSCWQRWESLRASLRVLHELPTLPHPHNLSFDLSGLRLTDFPAALLGLLPQQTYFLKLSDNALEAIPDDAFSRFQQLEHLYLANNRLTALSNDSLCGLRHLRSLDLSHNQLIDIAPAALKGLHVLAEFDVRYNMLTEIPRLPGSVTLVMLDNNRIARVTADALRGLHQLRDLRLQRNAITSVQLPAGGLQSLVHLNLSENLLAALEAPMHGMPRLGTLDLSQNRLITIEAGVFGGLPHLTRLNLSSNRIETISDAAFSESVPTPPASVAVVRIALRHNRLTQLPSTMQWPSRHGAVLVDLRDNLFSADLIQSMLATQPDAMQGQATVLLLLKNPLVESEQA